MKWITPEYLKNPREEINILKNISTIIQSDTSNKIIVTDYQFLSSLISNVKISPNKWYDELSVPSENNKFFEIYKNFYLKKLKEQNINTIYIIGKSKKKFIDILFQDKDCFEEKNINDKLLKLKIENCTF